MRSALCKSAFKVKWEDSPDAGLRPEEVRVRISHCGICGSDIHDLKTGLRSWQRLGHEMVGTVESMGDQAEGFGAGMPVAVRNAASCGSCEACRSGSERFCSRIRACIGGFSTHIHAHPRALMPLEKLPLDQAVLVEPINVAIDLIRTAEVKKGQPVVVVGLGPIGILTAMLCHQWFRSPVWAAGRAASSKRVRLLERSGLKSFVALSGKDSLEAARREFAPLRDAQFLVTAPPSVITDFLQFAAAFGSRFTVIGLSHTKREESMEIAARDWIFRRFQLRTSFAYPNLYFEEARQVLTDRVVPAESLITHRFPLSALRDAVRLVAEKRDGVIKAVVAPDRAGNL